MFESSVVSDMSRLQLLALARRLAAAEPEALHGIVLGWKHTTQWRTPDGRAVLLPDEVAIRESLASVFEAPSPGKRPEGLPCPEAGVALKHKAPVAGGARSPGPSGATP